MKPTEFTPEQREALLDLAMLAMYADGHLAAAEDERVQRLLSTMGYTTEYDQSREYDDSVSRVSRHSTTAASAQAYAIILARRFETLNQRGQVQRILAELVASDSAVTSQETNFLTLVREALQS